MTKNPTDDYIIAAVPVTLIDVVWSQCIKHIERVVERSHGELTLESVKEKLLKGNALLVTINKGSEIVAVNTMEVRIFESGVRAMYIPITGGDDLDGWQEQFEKVAGAIAKDFNCTELRALAVRRGWEKKLIPSGWENVHMVMRKQIED